MKSYFFSALILLLAGVAHGQTKPALRAEDGGLGHDVIDSAIKTKMPAVHQCYADELERKPSLGKTKVRIKLVIEASGSVKSIDAVSNASNQHLERCLEQELKGLTFPRPVGGGTVEVSYPFQFSPSDSLAPKAKR